MKMLFVDTAGWVAAADADDPGNEAVRRARDDWLETGGLLVTSDYVCDETLTTLRIRLGLSAARAWWDQVVASQRLRFEAVDADRARRARELFFRYTDKDSSFTDCTSFALMRELGIRDALTLDHHFRQMHFRILPAAAGT